MIYRYPPGPVHQSSQVGRQKKTGYIADGKNHAQGRIGIAPVLEKNSGVAIGDADTHPIAALERKVGNACVSLVFLHLFLPFSGKIIAS